MGEQRESLRPLEGGARPGRDRFGLKEELLLALLPTATVLGVLGLLETFSNQRLLFASLAASAFLIYLDPRHATNTLRPLVSSHVLAAAAGLLTFLAFGHGYTAAATAMIATIALMVPLDVVHPPAVSTSLTFALRSGAENDLVLFGFALVMTAGLVALQRSAVWLLARFEARADRGS